MEELYGTMMEKTTINQESKNLQYLTNELFKAAKKDLRSDAYNAGQREFAKNQGKSKQEVENMKSTNAFGSFIDGLEGKIGRKFTSQERSGLLKDYKGLKKELKKTRVMGVGKGFAGGAKTFSTNILRVLGSACRGIVFSIGGGVVGALGALGTGAGMAGPAGLVLTGLSQPEEH